MIRDMILPQLAMGMSEATLVEWVVKEGGQASRDDVAVIIETEKVTTELPAPCAGFVHILIDRGVTVPVETVIARIADTEDEYRHIADRGARLEQQEGRDGTQSISSSAPAAAPGDQGGGKKIRVSGLAKKLSQQHGVNLSRIVGTGPGQRIIRRDILGALAKAKPAVHELLAVAEPPPISESKKAPEPRPQEKTRIPLAGMRKAIAERMPKSKTTAAHTYFFFEVDVTKTMAARDTMLAREAELGARVSQVAILVRALALACQHVPICNATLENDEIIVWNNVNVGIVVALPGRTEYESGLLVPVVRDAENKGVLAIDREMKELVAKARDGRLTPLELAGGTITLSSTNGFVPGVWCISTPLINQPQVVNFQPGTVIEKPVVVDGQVVTRTMLPCGLSFDHRAMDGEPVGRFVRKLTDLLSHPELMLL